MAATGLLKTLYLTRFSKPVADRVVYRSIARQHPRRIVLLGLGDGERAVRMVELAQRYAGTDTVEITGIDLFEGRPHGARTDLTLKAAHRRLRDTGAQVKLVPGDPYSALARTANGLPKIDLLVVDADQDADSLAQAWFYAPRMLSKTSLVLIERDRGLDENSGQRTIEFERLDLAAIEQLASSVRVRRAA